MFVSKIRAEAGGDRSPYGDFWFTPTPYRGGSGASVSPESAMRFTAVYACVRVLSETFATLNFKLYRQHADGGKEIITDHWLNRLFNKRPNAFQNPFEWREMCQGHIVLRGNCFNQIFTNGRGEITDLVPIHPDLIRIEMLDGGNFRYRVKRNGGQDEILQRGQVWKLCGLSSNGLFGLNPIEIARDAIGMGLSAQDYGSRFFANDARPTAGWIEMQGGFSTQGARDTFRESWQAAQAGMNRGKVPVLENGMKYHPVDVNNRDSQFLEARQFQLGEIARMFRMPPHLIGDLSRSTNNNIEQQSLEFVTFTMTPWAERWEAGIEADLLLDDEDLEVEFDFSNLLRGDSAARVAYYTGGINGGWLTRNEARVAENLNPIDGLDEPLQPLNMAELGADPADATSSDNKTPQPPADDAASARLLALASASAARVARKEAESVKGVSPFGAKSIKTFYDKHAHFIAGALCVDLAAARLYCEGQTAYLLANESILWTDFEKIAQSKLERLALNL